MEICIEVRAFIVYFLPSLALTLFYKSDDKCKQRNARHYNESQWPMHYEHKNYDEYKVENFQHEVDYSVGKDIRNAVYIVDNANENFSVRTAVIILEREPLEMLEKVGSYIENDVLTDCGHYP